MTEADPVVRSGAEPARDRPRQVTIVSVLLAIFGGLGLMMAMLLLSIVNDEGDLPGWIYVLVYGQLLLSGAQILTGIFVWLGKSWARTVATVICGVNLVGAVLSVFSGAFLQAITAAAVNIALIRLLRSNEVAEWCE
jgi:hypothetical protein